MQAWFRERQWIYGVFLVVQFFAWLLTGKDFPQESFLLYTILHHIVCVPILFVHSYYSIRLLLFREYYAWFILACAGLITFSGALAYLFYSFVPDDTVSINALVSNRLTLLAVPTIFEVFIRYKTIQEKISYIESRQQVLQLSQQVNPHLVFNAFNSLQRHIARKADNINDLVGQLADITRYSLKISTNIFVSLEDEYHYLQSYISLEKNRVGENLKVVFTTQGDLRKYKVPAMAFIVLVENAFKFSPNNGQITIELVAEGNRIFVQVENNKKTENQLSTGTGLVNLRKRLQLLYGKNFDLQLTESTTVYKVILSIPQQNHEFYSAQTSQLHRD